MAEKAKAVLLNAPVRCPDAIDMELWNYALRHVATHWNHTPRPYLGFKYQKILQWYENKSKRCKHNFC